MIYRNKFINTASLVLTIIIFLILNILFNYLKSTENPIEQIKIQQNEEKEITEEKEEVVQEQIEIGNWYIEIPSINLKAPISQGTDLETLNTKVGHFTETSLNYGNIGLAAHNRGYEYNYFENLKNVKIEEKIIYNYENIQRTYIIDTIEIIKNTDWSYLEATEENKITLITCVENEPLYRRCVQGTSE